MFNLFQWYWGGKSREEQNHPHVPHGQTQSTVCHKVSTKFLFVPSCLYLVCSDQRPHVSRSLQVFMNILVALRVKSRVGLLYSVCSIFSLLVGSLASIWKLSLYISINRNQRFHTDLLRRKCLSLRPFPSSFSLGLLRILLLPKPQSLPSYSRSSPERWE